MAEILAIAHPDGGTVGVLAEAASEQSLAIEHWIPAEGGEPQRPLDQYSGLVVLGGDENIDEVDRYPYLEREYEIVNDWIEAGRPLFGVCLGAQMIAHVSGGSVFKASEREFGWEQIDVLPQLPITDQSQRPGPCGASRAKRQQCHAAHGGPHEISACVAAGNSVFNHTRTLIPPRRQSL